MCWRTPQGRENFHFLIETCSSASLAPALYLHVLASTASSPFLHLGFTTGPSLIARVSRLSRRCPSSPVLPHTAVMDLAWDTRSDGFSMRPLLTNYAPEKPVLYKSGETRPSSKDHSRLAIR